MRELFLHELRSNLFSGKFAIAFFLMLVTFFISLGMMMQEYQGRLDNYNESLSLSGKDLFFNKIFFWQSENGNTSSSDTLTFPMGKVKKPEPMLFFSRGLDPEMRQSVEFMATFPIVDLSLKPDQQVNVLKNLFEAPDLLFVVKVLVSLLAVLFAYNIICEEREKGTLKLLLVSGASRVSFFGGKFLGGLLSIWTAFTAAFLVYLIALVFLTPVDLQGETSLRVVLIYAASLLHVAVFFSIGAAISALTRHAAPSLILSLFLWMLIVFALPGLSSLLAQQFVPVDSRQKVARTKLEKAQAMEREEEQRNPTPNTRSNTAGYGERHDEIRHLINAELQKIDNEHQRRKELQAIVTTNLARVSPVGSLTYLYSALSRNGLEDAALYKRDLLDIRNEMDEEITSMLQDPDFGRMYMAGGFDMTEEFSNIAAGFFDIARNSEFRRLTLGETIASAWIDFVLLGVFALVVTAISFVRFLVYDPR